MGFVAGQQKKLLPAGTQVAADVGIGPLPTGFGIEVTLNITLPGMPAEEAQALVDAAHIVCPYSNATRGNIDVTLKLV
jgi:Ohr subfamily peroxiredoxin